MSRYVPEELIVLSSPVFEERGGKRHPTGFVQYVLTYRKQEITNRLCGPDDRAAMEKANKLSKQAGLARQLGSHREANRLWLESLALMFPDAGLTA